MQLWGVSDRHVIRGLAQSGIFAMYRFKMINSDCVIGRRSITMQLASSILAKLIILKSKLHEFHHMKFECHRTGLYTPGMDVA